MLGSSSYPPPAGAAMAPGYADTIRPAGWWSLGLMRILTGLIWYSQLLWIAPRDFGYKGRGGCPANLYAPRSATPLTGLTGLCDWMHREALHPLKANLSLHAGPYALGHTFSTGVFATFVRDTVLTHFTLFAGLTFGIQTFIAASLILGLFTRLGGLVGAVWSLVLLIGLWSVPGEWFWTYVMLAALNCIFFATRAGRYFGLDALLTRTEGPLSGLLRLVG